MEKEKEEVQIIIIHIIIGHFIEIRCPDSSNDVVCQAIRKYTKSFYSHSSILVRIDNIMHVLEADLPVITLQPFTMDYHITYINNL
jgi:hypothetical protein